MIKLVDGIGPFFSGYGKEVVNWSKIPFDNLEVEGRVDEVKFREVKRKFRVFARRVAKLGYNAVSLDDVAHVVVFDFYSDALKKKIAVYKRHFGDCFEIAKQEGLDVFVTTDIMFYNPFIVAQGGKSVSKVARLLGEAFERLFVEFPGVKGVIARFGESDGVDVDGDFVSALTLKKPRQVRFVLEKVLPVFERHDRKLIFRTWTVGAHGVGDVMWNRKTYRAVFRNVASPSLIVSMKYGESDFFRFLELNPLFFEKGQRKMVEFQARREYEGGGLLPSFVGWEYEKYCKQLAECDDLVGVSVWCQTGGWSKRKSMTFLDGSSLWNELNTMVALKVFEGVSVEVAVKQFCKEYKIGNVRDFVRFLRLSDELIASVLYVGEFARERLFFRRVRVPPLLWVYWDMVLVNRLTRALVRAFVPDRRRVAEVSRRAAVLLEEWRALGVRLGLSKEELRFQFVTFRLLIVCREHLLLKRDAGELADVVEAYHLLYPEGYVFLVEGGDGGLLVRWLVRRLVRRGHRYGIINWAVFDRVVCFMLGRVVRRLKLPLDGRGMTTGVILK